MAALPFHQRRLRIGGHTPGTWSNLAGTSVPKRRQQLAVGRSIESHSMTAWSGTTPVCIANFSWLSYSQLTTWTTMVCSAGTRQSKSRRRSCRAGLTSNLSRKLLKWTGTISWMLQELIECLGLTSKQSGSFLCRKWHMNKWNYTGASWTQKRREMFHIANGKHICKTTSPLMKSLVSLIKTTMVESISMSGSKDQFSSALPPQTHSWERNSATTMSIMTNCFTNLKSTQWLNQKSWHISVSWISGTPLIQTATGGQMLMRHGLALNLLQTLSGLGTQ